MSTLLLTTVVSSTAPPLTWLVATDWDDTVKAGGHSFYGVRGVGQRIKGTYPGVTTLLVELDECGGTSSLPMHKASFQVWSANPFSNKKPTSCIPPLHRKPVTRRGSLIAGLGWVVANSVPERLAAARSWALERSACALGDVKFRAFRHAAKTWGPATEIIFIGDSAQGDATAARRMLEDPQHGERTWVLLHDLTREVEPGKEPIHHDERIAIRRPFGSAIGASGEASDTWRSRRLCYYKTTPEAAFLLAQHGFLTRDALKKVVDATRREMVGWPGTLTHCPQLLL